MTSDLIAAAYVVGILTGLTLKVMLSILCRPKRPRVHHSTGHRV
jgi:hypothetical protein